MTTLVERLTKDLQDQRNALLSRVAEMILGKGHRVEDVSNIKLETKQGSTWPMEENVFYCNQQVGVIRTSINYTELGAHSIDQTFCILEKRDNIETMPLNALSASNYTTAFSKKLR